MATLESVIWILAGKEKDVRVQIRRRYLGSHQNASMVLMHGRKKNPIRTISKQVQKHPAKEKQQTFSHLQISTNPIRKHGARPGSSLFYHYITRYRATRRQATIARSYQ